MVRDEAETLPVSLTSVVDQVDSVVVVDTGSVDDTVDVAHSLLAGSKYWLEEQFWHDFGTNRTSAFNCAVAKFDPDWIFVPDADFELIAPPDAIRHGIESHPGSVSAMVDLDYGTGMVSPHKHLLRADVGWHYVGRVHEYVCRQDGGVDTCFDLTASNDVLFKLLRGSRMESRDDLAALWADVVDRSDDPRPVFYLAQSCADKGLVDLARLFYNRRFEMGGWEEECWLAGFRAAVLEGDVGRVAELQSGRPSRPEPLLWLAKEARGRGEWELALKWASMERGVCDDILFVDEAAARWGLKLEAAIALWWLGRKVEADVLNNELLADEGLPGFVRETVLRNMSL